MAIHQHIIINTRKTYALAAMATQLMLQMMLVLLFIQETSAQQNSVSKPGCQQTCGSLQITYPFGIGADCSANKTHEISCNNSYNPPKAFLNDNNLEVLDISLETGTIRVNSPVITNCGDTSDDQKVLSSGNFTFSGTRNQFTAMGCETLAVITQPGLFTGGCMTFCNGATSIFADSTCFGFCCQTKIPDLSLNLINTSLRSIDAIKYQNVCRQAFIVDQDWFGSLTNIISVRTMEHVPAVLDWIPIGRCDSFRYVDDPTKNRFVCGRNAFCTDRGLCSCRTGYEGNPYLSNGCQDINECATGVDNCSQICTNMPGSYRCSCRNGWEYDGKNCKISPNKNVLILIIIATGAGLGFLIAAMWWLYKVIRRRNIRKLKETFFKRNGGLLLQQQVSSSEGNVETTKLFTSKELEKATDHYNIDRIIGQGGQGTVYKGMLTDGRIVAVKKSKIEGGSKLEQFINEVVILSQINHRNVVKLHGCCLETEVPLLVYEFIPNGTLFQYIHDHNEDFPLSWDICVRVATEIAGALSYLHSSASIPIYHRDIKSTNILLDDKYRVKVADFGTSRSICIDQTHVTTKVQGTFGYLDPEYFQSTQFTDKSDVYSFGVVLVELLTGQKPILEPRPDDEARSLATLFILAMQEDRILDVLDPRIMIDGKKDEIIAFSNLAFRCLNMNGRNRPTMKQVAAVLESIRMSNGLYTAQNHYEDVDHAGAELYGAWDLTLTSRSSSIDKSLTIDIVPLITKN